MKAKLIVIGGSIGTGKTTLAYKLKEHIEKNLKRTCIILESDTERRIFLGYPLKYRMNEPDYSPEVSQQVFALMDKKREEALRDKRWVIQALTSHSVFGYRKIQQSAAAMGIDFTGIFLTATEETIRERLIKREHERNQIDDLRVERGHASDADAGVLLKYPIPDYIPKDWIAIDAEQTPEKVFEDAIKAL